MTLGYTKMFLIVTEEAVVKGHFCSLLLSNIYWLTSLSTDQTRSVRSIFSHSASCTFLFFHFPEAGSSCMWEFGFDRRCCLFSVLCFSDHGFSYRSGALWLQHLSCSTICFRMMFLCLRPYLLSNLNQFPLRFVTLSKYAFAVVFRI